MTFGEKIYFKVKNNIYLMKYATFINQTNIKERLMVQCGIIRSERIFIKLDHFPNYDMSDYEGVTGKDYVFNNFWQIPDRMKSVLKFKFGTKKIYHHDHLEVMAQESGIRRFREEEDFLNSLLPIHSNILDENGFEVDDMDEFKLRTLRLDIIDNERRKINYSGVFFGDSSFIGPDDWAVYVIINVTYVPIETDLVFYESLLGESYTLCNEHRFKLSFFTLFSAFECFINTELSFLKSRYSNLDDSRLTNDVKELFQTRFSTVQAHQIYESLMPQFLKIKILRNDIAHGKGPVYIDEKFLEKAFLFVLISILSFKEMISTFLDLSDYLEKHGKLA